MWVQGADEKVVTTKQEHEIALKRMDKGQARQVGPTVSHIAYACHIPHLPHYICICLYVFTAKLRGCSQQTCEIVMSGSKLASTTPQPAYFTCRYAFLHAGECMSFLQAGMAAVAIHGRPDHSLLQYCKSPAACWVLAVR